jgi:DNA recombination protein RmuC
MRKTVDEKLHATLEQRLGDSFKLVSERLEQVHRGLGEMQTLAAGVGDLKKVLTNVKTRGTWGEVQLEALLDQVLTAEQYEKNIATRPKSNERVEFAIRLPGREMGEDDNRPVWLPIDAKFPMEDYQRLLEAQDRADPLAVEIAAKALEMRLRDEAKKIRDKYVEPPYTTDFAILYLPIEGLYAEALRRPGLAEALQRDWRVSIAGPTTLAALLNSLQMGFRTLAIEKRSSEVWGVLGAIKTEFGKFGEALEATRKKLEQATKSIESAGVRTRQIERKLKGVEALPMVEAQARLGELEEIGLIDDEE